MRTLLQIECSNKTYKTIWAYLVPFRGQMAISAKFSNSRVFNAPLSGVPL